MVVVVVGGRGHGEERHGGRGDMEGHERDGVYSQPALWCSLSVTF